MNGRGIALATDSAATVYVEGKPKVYHADKLFMLSHHHPVGVMVYNNSALLGVPWETILKMFRKKLGDRGLPTLAEYGEELIDYLSHANRLFPSEVQSDFYLNLVETLFRGIQKEMARAIDRALSPDENRNEAIRIIQEALDDWRAKNNAICFDPKVGTDLATQHSGVVYKLIMQIFEPWRLAAQQVTALFELAALVVSKEDILHESLSGVVIAGFGEDEHFPVMQAYELGEIFKDKLKYRKMPIKRIDSKTSSVVEPFAQSEMVNAFLNGISPAFEVKLYAEMAALVLGLPEAVIDEISGMSAARKKVLKEKVLPRSEEVYRGLIGEFERHRIQKHLDPILQSIAFLPKNELAHVAASLVNLNSFQKRMSIREDETVGGPIDVAVISKGDGFVWIERKHYFRSELNHHFFKNYGIPFRSQEIQHGEEDRHSKTDTES